MQARATLTETNEEETQKAQLAEDKAEPQAMTRAEEDKYRRERVFSEQLGPATELVESKHIYVPTGIELHAEKAEYRSYKGSKWVNQLKNDYSNSWESEGMDFRDHVIILEQGTFLFRYGRSRIDDFYKYMSGRLGSHINFSISLSAIGEKSGIEFKTKTPGVALYIEKYPHDNGAEFAVFEFQDKEKFLSAFHGEAVLAISSEKSSQPSAKPVERVLTSVSSVTFPAVNNARKADENETLQYSTMNNRM